MSWQSLSERHEAAIGRALLSLGNFDIQAGLVGLVVNNKDWHSLHVQNSDEIGQALESSVMLENGDQYGLLIFLRGVGIAPIVQHIADRLCGSVVRRRILELYPAARTVLIVEP